MLDFNYGSQWYVNPACGPETTQQRAWHSCKGLVLCMLTAPVAVVMMRSFCFILSTALHCHT